MLEHYTGLKNIHSYPDRHGKLRIYYRLRGRRTPLPTCGTREECLAAYYSAASEMAKGTPRVRTLPRRSADFEVCVNRILVAIKARCKEKGFDTNITAAWLREEFARLRYRCEVTGLPFSTARTGSGRNPFAPSADRKDNSLGYTTENVRLVLASVNIAISDWGDAHFDQICRAYVLKHSANNPTPRGR